MEHDDEIHSVDIDSKGRYVATGSRDGTVFVWDIADATSIARMKYADNVHILAFDPSDDTLLLSVSENVATLSKLRRGRPDQLGRKDELPPLETIFELRHEAPINSAEFNSKGDRVVTSDEDGTCRVWDVSTGKGSELERDGEVTRAIFSSNGEFVATLAGSQLRLWQMGQTPICKQKLDHDSAVIHARFSRDGLVIFTGTEKGKVQAWNIATGQPVGEPIRVDGDPILDLDSQGKQLLVAASKGTARVWKPAPRYPMGDRFVHSAGVESTAVSPDGRLLLTTSADNTACLWDLAKRQVPPTRFLEGEALCGAFSADGNIFAIGTVDGTARLWLTSSGQPDGQALQAGGPVGKLAFSPDSKLLATATDDGIVQFWDLGSLGAKGKPMTHAPGIRSLEFKADGKLFLTVGADSKVRCWRVGTGEPVDTPLSDHTAFTCARFSPNKDLIATGSSSGAAQIWPVTPGNPIDLPFYDYSGVTDVCFSPDGHYLAIASEAGQVMVDDVAMSRPVGTPMYYASPVLVVQFSPDSSRIATAYEDGTVQLWNTTSGRLVSEQLRQGKAVRYLAFSRDNSTLFSGSGDGTVEAYDIKTGLTSADRESLATFSRAISSVSLLDSGIAEPHLVETLDRLRVTARSLSPGTRTLANWLFSEPIQRPLTPFSRINLAVYMDCRVRDNLDASTYEMLYLFGRRSWLAKAIAKQPPKVPVTAVKSVTDRCPGQGISRSWRLANQVV